MMAHPAFDLDWNLVRTFVAVANSGSLAGGARQLGITHPTAARHIQQLEQSLGVSLFSRTSKGLVLNEAGMRLDDAARVMHASALAFQAATDRMRHVPVSRVRVSVAEMIGELLPDLLFRQLQPESAGGIAIDTVVTDELLNLLERQADIAIRHVRPEQQELVCRRVGSLPMTACASADYVAQFGTLDMADIGHHRFIDGLSKDYFVRGAARKGYVIDSSQVVFRSDSIGTRRAAVSAGWGIGAFPLWMLEQHPTWQPVTDVRQSLELDVWLVARPEVRDNQQLGEVFSSLSDALSEYLTCKSANGAALASA